MTELERWAGRQRQLFPELVRVGLFGSYATGGYSPGSDIDVLLVVKQSKEPRWFMRAAAFDTSELTVGADLFVYTESEVARMQETSGWFRSILRQMVWID
jgi:predicted nucleotidyltransferase